MALCTVVAAWCSFFSERMTWLLLLSTSSPPPPPSAPSNMRRATGESGRDTAMVMLVPPLLRRRATDGSAQVASVSLENDGLTRQCEKFGGGGEVLSSPTPPPPAPLDMSTTERLLRSWPPGWKPSRDDPRAVVATLAARRCPHFVAELLPFFKIPVLTAAFAFGGAGGVLLLLLLLLLFLLLRIVAVLLRPLFDPWPPSG